MSEYKPGTVAVATVRGVPNVLVMRTETFFERDRHVWASSTLANSGAWHLESDVTDVRPLVVLDLDAAYGCWAEKRDPAVIVERLRETNSVAAQAIADQIEQQTKPPKPAEPTGLGAVVEDGEGDHWVRASRIVSSHRNDWHCAGGTSMGRDRRHWDGIDAVRVLSDGVQP